MLSSRGSTNPLHAAAKRRCCSPTKTKSTRLIPFTVAQGLGVVVGVQPVLVILQRRSQLDWRS